MKYLFSLLLLVALPAFSAGPVTQVQTCMDSPQIPSPSGYGACKKVGCGPAFNTDRVRTNDPANKNNQIYESWATLAAGRPVVACLDGKPVAMWTTKGTVQANPPAPPTTVPPINTPPAAFTKALTMVWGAPTANTDGSTLTDLAGYVIYQGTSAASLAKVATVTSAGVLTFTTNALPVGTYFFAVSAVNLAGKESGKSGVISTTITSPAPAASTPNTPTDLKFVPDAFTVTT